MTAEWLRGLWNKGEDLGEEKLVEVEVSEAQVACSEGSCLRWIGAEWRDAGFDVESNYGGTHSDSVESGVE
jgi:hypothetical protein